MYEKAIREGKRRRQLNSIISRKIYLSYPTAVFQKLEDMEFDILNLISEKFEIPFNSIQIIGSAKTGYSYFKKKSFEKGISDLDVAIIDQRLFTKYLEYAYDRTNGFSDLSTFYDEEHHKRFIKTIPEGFLNPFYLPRGNLKNEWFDFFNQNLSSKYIHYFKSINAGIYTSQYFFEMKQAHIIEEYMIDEGEV